MIRLRDALEDALEQNGGDPIEPQTAIDTVEAAVEAAELARWCAGAALEVAWSLHPAVRWQDLADVTAISDSTLHNRLKSWRRVRAGDSPPSTG